MQTVFHNPNRLIHVTWENNKKLDIINCQIILLQLTNFNMMSYIQKSVHEKMENNIVEK